MLLVEEMTLQMQTECDKVTESARDIFKRAILGGPLVREVFIIKISENITEQEKIRRKLIKDLVSLGMDLVDVNSITKPQQDLIKILKAHRQSVMWMEKEGL